MNITHQDVVLDVNYNKSNVIVNAHQGDTGTRFIDVTLTQSGEVITMSNTFTATAKASIYGAVKAVNECEVDTVNNKIIVELTNTMLDTPGKLICEITLSEGEQIITTQMFTVNVSQSVLNGGTEIVRNTELEKLLKVISLVPELSNLENLEDLREMVGDINTTINERTGEVKRTETPIELTVETGGLSGSIGSAITIGTQAYWCHTCISVSSNEKYKVKTYRYDNEAFKEYAYFTDENDLIVSTAIGGSATAGYVTEELTVPQGATKLYVKTGTSNPNFISLTKIDVIDLQSQINSQELQIDSQQAQIDSQREQIGEPIKSETPLELSEAVGALSGNIGSVITIGTQTYWYHTCVDVKAKETYKVKTYRYDNQSAMYVYFTDDNGVIVATAIGGTDTAGFVTEELVVPDEATKLYVRAGTSSTGLIKVWLIEKFTINHRVTEIENKIVDHLPPYYTQDWLHNHYSAINEQSQVLNGVSFAFVTDLHFPANAQNSKYLLKNILDNTTVPFVLCGGDFPQAYGTQEDCLANIDELIDYQNVIGKDRFFTVRGNHDFTIKTSANENTGYTAPVAKTYNALLRNSEFAISSIQAGKFYYHIDIPAQKTRIFMLCSCDTQASETTPWGLGYWVSQEQVDWLLEKMQEKDGWYYIFVSHIPADPAIESYHSSQDKLHDIMLALKNKTVYGDVDFSTSNNVAVCHIVGHNHNNCSNVDNNFLSISTTCDAAYSDDGDGAKKGTLTEQAFDVFTIDYDNGTVQTHRVGRGSDRNWNY